MILVTGATGTVGSELVRLLCAEGRPVRALARTPERADTLRGYDCEVAVADLDDPPSLDDALRGADAVFLLSPAGPRQAEQEIAVVEAAERAGVAAVVKVAESGYAEGWLGRVGDAHRRVVDRLRRSPLAHTVLAPNDFFQNLLRRAARVQEEGVLALPGGEAPVSAVDARDVAAVAAHVLTGTGHEGASYVVTGPESLTYAEVAGRLSAVAGCDVQYVDVAPEEYRRALLDRGVSEWQADAALEVFAAYRDGRAATVTDEVRRATGTDARPLDDFLAEHRSAFAAR